MRKKTILVGFMFIFAAIGMMAGAMGLLPDWPWFKLICSAVLGYWSIKALIKRNFVLSFFEASLITWLFAKELEIEHLVPFPLCVAALFLGIGLNMIVGKSKKKPTIDDVRDEEWKDGRDVVLKNNFNATSKYVNSTAFSNAKLENNFGSVNVYFNNANVYNKEAVIDLENNFGTMNIYLPNTWRATIKQQSAFGRVGIHGEWNRDMDAPHVIIKAGTNFGNLNIYFE